MDKMANLLGCYQQTIYKLFGGFSNAKCRYDLIDEMLRAELNDPLKGKAGEVYPFVKIVGKNYFTFVAENFCRMNRESDAVLCEEPFSHIRMARPHHYVTQTCVLYFTGILRTEAFVRENGLAQASIKLRSGDSFGLDELWCVPFGFEDQSMVSLNGLLAVDESVDLDGPQGVLVEERGVCQWLVSETTGLLTFHRGKSLHHNFGGARVVKKIPKDEVDTSTGQPAPVNVGCAQGEVAGSEKDAIVGNQIDGPVVVLADAGCYSRKSK